MKSTRKAGGMVDMHGARPQWLCVVVYGVDNQSEPLTARESMAVREIYLGQFDLADFRRNERGPLGTRTASLNRGGLAKLRANRVFLDR